MADIHAMRKTFITTFNKYKQRNFKKFIEPKASLQKKTSVPNVHEARPIITKRFLYASKSDHDLKDVMIRDNVVTYMDLFHGGTVEEIKGSRAKTGQPGGRVSKIDIANARSPQSGAAALFRGQEMAGMGGEVAAGRGKKKKKLKGKTPEEREEEQVKDKMAQQIMKELKLDEKMAAGLTKRLYMVIITAIGLIGVVACIVKLFVISEKSIFACEGDDLVWGGGDRSPLALDPAEVEEEAANELPPPDLFF